MIIAVTVTGKDQSGIIARLTQALYEAKGNLEDASMTILEGEFAMIFLATVKDAAGLRNLSSRLKKIEQTLKLTVTTKEIKRPLNRGKKHAAGTVPWMVSVSGRDRAGIVYQVSKVCADYQLNITDLESKILGKGKQTAYALILEVDVPKRDHRLADQIKAKFAALEKKLGVKIAFNPIESSHF